MKIVFNKICAFILMLCVFFSALPLYAQAGNKIIRVGCLDIENFLMLDNEGKATGYCAEYLNRIAGYTGWTYEYKKGSWSDCLEWLKRGEIDLLMPAEYTEERAKDYLFSDVECCLDYAALLGNKSNEKYYYDDSEAFNGITIGMINGNYLNVLFEKYAKTKGFSFNKIYFDTGTELSEALQENKVEAIVSGNLEYSNDQKLLAKIAYMPAYFITSRNNPHLMTELNNALHNIFLYNPYYTADIYSKYYDSLERQSIGFTKEELDYIKQKGKVTVLLNNDGYPIEWYDDSSKTFKGVHVDILNLIEKESGLDFQFVAADTFEEQIDTIKSGKADVLGCAYPLDYNTSTQDFLYTNSYYITTFSIVAKREKSLSFSDTLTIGVLENEKLVKSLIEKEFPYWNIILYKNPDECFNAALKSKVDLVVINSWRLYVDKHILNNDLIEIDGNTLSAPISIGVPRESDPLLFSVLNKALLKVEDSEIQECVFNSLLSVKEEESFFSYLIKEPVILIFSLMILLTFVLTGAFIIYRNHLHKKQNHVLQLKNRELRDAISLQEQLRKAAQTDSLTGLKNKSIVECMCQDYLTQYPDESHAILVMDLDNFKQINDTNGHLYGDAVLREFANILMKESNPGDVVGRIGGDEFLIFIPCIKNRQDVENRVELLYQKMNEQNSEIVGSIYCSIGIVISENSHLKFNDLFSKADMALYKAKSDGKNKFIIVMENN